MQQLYEQKKNEAPWEYETPYEQVGLVDQLCQEGDGGKDGPGGTCAYFKTIDDFNEQLISLQMPQAMAAQAMLTIVGGYVEIITGALEAGTTVKTEALKDLPDAQNA